MSPREPATGRRSAEGAYELADLDGERLEEARHGRLHLVGRHLRQLLGHVLQVLGHALLVDVQRVLRAVFRFRFRFRWLRLRERLWIQIRIQIQ